MKYLLKRCIPAGLRVKTYIVFSQLLSLGLFRFLKWQWLLLDAQTRCLWNKRHYRVYSASALLASRTSDTVFLFGSGASLKDLSQKEWEYFARHNTLGFSGFIYSTWVRVDYHLVRGWVEFQSGTFLWRNYTTDYAMRLNANPCFRDTTLVLQADYLGQFCNALIGYRLLREGSKVFLYATERGSKMPTSDIRKGLSHSIATLCDAVNFAYCMGWKKIVLVGVDLYDSRYFWLKPNETNDVDHVTGMVKAAEYSVRGARYDETHNTARNGIVELMASWRKEFNANGVEMMVYNPRSLMAEVMPVFRIPEKEIA
jgi:hypothetical protein